MTPHDEIIQAFIDQYGLTRAEVVTQIENTLSSMLSRWFEADMLVLFGEEELQAMRYRKRQGLLIQEELDLHSLRGWNTLIRIIDRNLRRSLLTQEVARYKIREREVRWGTILHRKDEGFLVELEVEEGAPILAECPLNRVGVHERDRFTPGQRRAFHLRRVEAIVLHDTPRIRVTVDRVSKTLTGKLLFEKVHNVAGLRITCTKRFVGHKSFVIANHFLPLRVIGSVARELGEHIQVTVP